jgi:hypothetical protein
MKSYRQKCEGAVASTAKRYGSKNEKGEVNVYVVIMSVLMLTVGISLVAMFNGIFPAVTGNVIVQQNVTETNPMYDVVNQVDENAESWYGLNSTVMTIGIVAVLASIALGIFAFGRRA